MLDELIKKIKESGIDVTPLKYLDDSEEEFHFIYVNDKLVFLCELQNTVNELIEFSKKVRELVINDFKKILIYLKENDLVERVPSLKAFLWDIYIIGIHIDEQGEQISQEEIFMVQRDTYIGKKIIIVGKTIEDIYKEVIEYLSPEKYILSLIKGQDMLMDSKEILQYLINGNDSEPISKPLETISDIKKYIEEIKLVADKEGE